MLFHHLISVFLQLGISRQLIILSIVHASSLAYTNMKAAAPSRPAMPNPAVARAAPFDFEEVAAAVPARDVLVEVTPPR